MEHPSSTVHHVPPPSCPASGFAPEFIASSTTAGKCPVAHAAVRPMTYRHQPYSSSEPATPTDAAPEDFVPSPPQHDAVPPPLSETASRCPVLREHHQAAVQRAQAAHGAPPQCPHHHQAPPPRMQMQDEYGYAPPPHYQHPTAHCPHQQRFENLDAVRTPPTACPIRNVPDESKRRSSRPASLKRHIGKLVDLAKTPGGSSFLQGILKRTPECFGQVFDELEEKLPELLLNDNACYLAKMLLEMCDGPSFLRVLEVIGNDDELWVALATRSLHSRRIVQFLHDREGAYRCPFLGGIAQRNFHALATSKEGCITLQRILDRCDDTMREGMFDQCRASLVQYSQDSFANFVVQYMFERGDREANLIAVRAQLHGQLMDLCCDENAAGVVEKAVKTLGPEMHRRLAVELFGSEGFPTVSDKDDAACEAPGEDSTLRIMNHSHGNYVVQALLSACDEQVLPALAARVEPYLPRLTYGPRMQTRLVSRGIQVTNSVIASGSGRRPTSGRSQEVASWRETAS